MVNKIIEDMILDNENEIQSIALEDYSAEIEKKVDEYRNALKAEYEANRDKKLADLKVKAKVLHEVLDAVVLDEVKEESAISEEICVNADENPNDIN